jgi:hypothetical protein
MANSKSNAVANKVKAAKRLIDTCERAILGSEYSLYSIRGVENLSRSDVDMIIYYCNYFITNKTIGGLMPPRGGVGEVLKKIDIVEKGEGWGF